MNKNEENDCSQMHGLRFLNMHEGTFNVTIEDRTTCYKDSL